MITKKQRTLAAMICVIVLLAVVSTSLLLIHELDHDCIGEDCSICICIDHAKHLLKQLGAGRTESFAVILAASFILSASLSLSHPVSSRTLVSQKVRLNN